MIEGAQIGRYNSRGVVGGEGGQAAKYRRWAKALEFTFPFVVSRLLIGLAETYENEAHREQAEAVIRRRLN